MTKFTGASWSASLPTGWQAEPTDECDSIFNPEGVGVLQVSAYSKETTVSEQDLIDLASEHIESGAKTKSIVLGEFSGITLSFGTEGEYWRHWYLRAGLHALFVTYNCETEDRLIKEGLINTILNSLRVIS